VDETTTKQIHPVRGALWGLLFGVGLAGVLVLTTLITLELVTVLGVVVVGVVAGIAWGSLGPARPPKGPAPPQMLVVEQVVSSTFDARPRRPATSNAPTAEAPTTGSSTDTSPTRPDSRDDSTDADGSWDRTDR
jgi:hypothetical protein